MKTLRIPRCFLALGFTCLSSLVSNAQTPPVLGIQLCAGVSISGTSGSVYAIQATSDLSNSNGWSCVALVQLPATNYIWADTSTSAASGQRFYRAVPTASNLAYIPPGTFTMGSPTNEALRGTDEAQYLATLSKGFYMGKYPVTQSNYVSVVGTNPSTFSPANGYANGLTRPVENIRWADATNYCALLTAREQAAGLIPTNWAYRLPTETEWEYACRAGTTTAFYLGNDLVSGQANFNGMYGYDAASGIVANPSGTYLAATTPVGQYLPPNAWGLYDMIGNVFEWCEDWYGPYPTTGPGGSVIDPQGAAAGPNQVMRGFGYTAHGNSCRSASRYYISAMNFRWALAGFRVVLAQQ